MPHASTEVLVRVGETVGRVGETVGRVGETVGDTKTMILKKMHVLNVSA